MNFYDKRLDRQVHLLTPNDFLEVVGRILNMEFTYNTVFTVDLFLINQVEYETT